MRANGSSIWWNGLALAVVGTVWLGGPGCRFGPSTRSPLALTPATVLRTNYHGWPDAYILRNGMAEVVIVPAIGRIMQFGFLGEEGVFWENRALDGQTVNAAPDAWKQGDWVNFGGDKAWPSPEADWGKFTGRAGWRPPPAFDGMPHEARVEGGAVVLTSPIDPFYGIRSQRRVWLVPGRAELWVTTTFERVSGEPASIGAWVITQLKDPVALFAPLPRTPVFPEGFTLLGKETPPSLKSADGFVTLGRDHAKAFKIGLGGDSLLWVGQRHLLRINSVQTFGGSGYPDHGSKTEIYTNPDPLPYIELETLSPLSEMKAGDYLTHFNTYTLLRRTKSTPEQEARAIFRRR